MGYKIDVKQPRRVDWFLVALCGLLAASTLAFALLSVRNARPMSCDRSTSYEDGTILCETIIIRNED